ncbi:MAG: RecX family transcriptional regulator [Clostridia bacterium]|nr:RecX family transcriptional regulator [Clostridia bacterium]
MNILFLEKNKYRTYKSEQIVEEILGKKLIHVNGAPKIDDGFISISDTKNYWCCAISENPVGVDIEEFSRVVKPNLAKKLHPSEQDYLSALAPGSSEWREEFLSIWVRKEAFMKLKEEGLRMGLSSFSVIDDGITQSFIHKKLFVGIAGDPDYSIKWVEYDAPFIQSCLDCAAGFLDTRTYSEAELRNKLKERTYPDEDIDYAIEKLLEYGYINDALYAQNWADKLANSGKAPRRIEYELMKKGLSKELAKDAASSYKENSREAAMEIALKYKAETEKDLAKIGRKLSSLGYEATIIYDILSRLRKS